MKTSDLPSSKILKKVLFDLPHGMPVSAIHLKKFGVSRQLAHRYVQYGWLKQLGYGYYLREGDQLTETGAVASLQANGVKVHIGGKSSLARKGFTHYLSMGGETLTLYGQGVRSLPKWFQEQFNVDLSNSALFEDCETLAERYCVSRMNNEPNSPFASEPERAVLEMLDLIPNKQTIDEARQIMEGLYSLRAEKMKMLLKSCKKIKTKRLFWRLANELDLPVLKKIDSAEIDFGSKSIYMLSGEKNLGIKNPNE